MEVSRGRLLRSDAMLAVTILLLGLFLAATGASLTERWERSSVRDQSLAFEDLLGFVINTTGLIIVAWWILSMLIALTSAGLERAGSRRAAEITGKYSPSFMRRLTLAALGLQLLGAPLAHAGTVTADPQWSPTSPPATAAAVWMPTEHAASAPHPGPGATDPRWKPHAPVVSPGPLSAQPVRAARQQPVDEDGSVTVVAGDSLWTIAANQLGSPASDRDIALEWPRWYEANRAVLGENPDVLLPGQVLRPPSRS